MTDYLVPALNDLAVSVAAPALLLADPDGQVRAGGVSGWFVDDVRLLDAVVLSVDGSDLERVRSAVLGADRQEFTYVARRLGGWLHDPTVTVDRRRTLVADRLVEEVEVELPRPAAGRSSRCTSTWGRTWCRCPSCGRGQRGDPVRRQPTDGGLAWHHDGRGFAAAFDPAPSTIGEDGRVTWTTTVAPGSSYRVRLAFEAEGTPAFGPGGASPWGEVAVEAPDPRLGRVVAQSVADLGGLLMRDGDDAFLAAGSPWFLTLFGRDSLWAARLTMPFGTGLALSTLRTLARRQGERDDPETEEQPGKILHEVRNTTLESAA